MVPKLSFEQCLCHWLDKVTPGHFHKKFNLSVLGLLLTKQEVVRHFR
jgi:hypothetical protein